MVRCCPCQNNEGLLLKEIQGVPAEEEVLRG